jgi:hypothetical protein
MGKATAKPEHPGQPDHDGDDAEKAHDDPAPFLDVGVNRPAKKTDDQPPDRERHEDDDGEVEQKIQKRNQNRHGLFSLIAELPIKRVGLVLEVFHFALVILCSSERIEGAEIFAGAGIQTIFAVR